MRIVSLLPSATEIVCALGASSSLVGRSEECDYPETVRALPVVMRAKVHDADRSSAEIDARVRSVRGSGESLYSLDLDLLRTLAPDLLITQDLCSVCSVTVDEVRRAVVSLESEARVLSLSPRSLSEVWASIEEIGRSTGTSEAAESLAGQLRARTRPVGRGLSERRRVAVVEWLDPPILAGLWTPEIVEAAGGLAVGPRPRTPGARSPWEELRALRPDLVILSPCSFTVDRTLGELENPSIRSGLASLAPSLGVWIADEAYYSRPGPRLADGVELVRSLLRREVPRGTMPVERWGAGKVRS
ncbi:MAG TPA: cobalamin-binding protein [Thermoplasmata archaeon]|nr:cobalamin-binding protein [Thermoplasmata archaeon]